MRLVILIFGLFFCLSFDHLLVYLIILSLSPWLNLNFSNLQSIASLTASQTMPFVVRLVSLTQGSSTLFSHRSGKTALPRVWILESGSPEFDIQLYCVLFLRNKLKSIRSLSLHRHWLLLMIHINSWFSLLWGVFFDRHILINDLLFVISNKAGGVSGSDWS